MDITTALAFGVDVNTLERGEDELQRNIQFAFEMLGRRVLLPLPYWRWVQLPADRRLKRALASLEAAVGQFIEGARRRIDQRPELREAPTNFLEAMLAAQAIDGSFSDEEILGNTLTLLLAGEDTTAHSLAWTLWYLAREPDIQERWAILARRINREAGGPEFDPGRWLDGDRAPDQRSFLTFGAGPRFCPGRNLAMLEANCALAAIGRDFELELDESGGAVEEFPGFVMVPRGLKVRLRERKPGKDLSTVGSSTAS